jgi:segregation and condensation protein A
MVTPAPTTPVSLEGYRVELDAYAGPLDLLLYLVKRHEIDLNDIPIARLAEQYVEHLRLLQQVKPDIDVDLAGEFLVMAASLLEIKSQMLVPKPEADQQQAGGAEGGMIPTEENPLDPRYELVQQLLAYKRFKDAANELEARQKEWESRFPRTPGRHLSGGGELKKPMTLEDFENLPDEVMDIDLEDVHVLDLCNAFARILDSIGQVAAAHQVTYDDTPIALHAEDILDRLQREAPPGSDKGGMTLQEIFVGRKTRSEMIGLFLATLELVRQRRVRVVQDKVGGEIRLELRGENETANDDKPADWRDPQTGQMQYEWPSEEARVRAEKRAHLRTLYAEKRRRGEEVPAEADEVIDVDEEPAAEASQEADEASDNDATAS